MVVAFRVLVVDSDAGSRAAIRQILAAVPAVAVVGESESLGEAAAKVSAVQPDLLILEAQTGAGAVAELARRFPATAILATGGGLSAESVVQIIRAGAFEFLPRPVGRPDLVGALEKFARFRGISAPRERGRVTAVFSAKGGLGTTTVAVNLAVWLAGQPRGRTLLVELDTRQSDVVTQLDLRPRYSILDVLESVERMDDALLHGLLAKHESGLWVLPGPSRAERGPLAADQVRLGLEFLAARFDNVVLDLRHDVDPPTAAALEVADGILFLTTPNVSALRLGAAGLTAFRELGIDTEKVKVVVMRDGTGDDVTLKHVRETLGLPIAWRVPSDYRAVVASINDGRPIVSASSRSKVAQSLRDCAAALVMEASAAEPPLAKQGGPLRATAWPMKRLLGA